MMPASCVVSAAYIEIVAALNPEFFAAITPAKAVAICAAAASRDGQPFEVAPSVFVNGWATADILSSSSFIADPVAPAP